MPSANVKMLQAVAIGLGDLKDEMVFVGGAVAELYADNSSLSDIRATFDIDCIIEISSRVEHAKLEERLRKRGFTNDTSMGAPICRWLYKGVKVDVMPADSRVLGFTNRWYAEGIENRIVKTLPDGTNVFILKTEYYLATKFEAHKGRGGSDLRQSHDFEDIIYILDNCSNLLVQIEKANFTIKTYLRYECLNLLKNENLIEGIESALPYGSGDESAEIIKNMLESISKIEI